MITVTGDFTTKSNSQFRVPQFKVLFDWALTGDYQEETPLVKLVQVERSVNEPLGGVTLAQADVKFINSDRRYTPRKD